MRTPPTRRAATALLALALLASVASAQSRLRPPENNTGIEGKPWSASAVAVLLIGITVVGASLKSKRGHQD